MGRIRSGFVKRTGNKIISEHKAKLAKDFEKNKKIISEVCDVSTKKLRNLIAGYVTKKIKTAQEIDLGVSSN